MNETKLKNFPGSYDNNANEAILVGQFFYCEIKINKKWYPSLCHSDLYQNVVLSWRPDVTGVRTETISNTSFRNVKPVNVEITIL